MDYYAKEYYHSLKSLENKINNGNLLVSQKEKYIKILNTINNNVTSKKITYLKALVSLIHLEKEIDKYQQGYVASIIAKDYEERTFEGKFIEYDFKTRKETEEIEKGSSEPIDISLYKEVLKNFNYISEDDFIEFNLSSKEDEIKEEKKEEKELKKEIDEELYKEIEENITTNIKKEIIKNRRKTKKEKSNSTDELKQIKDNITTTLKEIKTSDILSNRSKIKIITYLTILSVLTSVPIFAFNKYKNISKEREYKTTKEIYTMMEPVEVEDEDNYEEVLGMGIPKKTSVLVDEFVEKKKDTTTYEVSYEPLQESDKLILVKESSPWITEGVNSKKDVTTYKIKDISFEDIIASDNLTDILSSSEKETTHEYSYTKDVSKGELAYPEKIYEFIRLVQDTKDYIETGKPVEKTIELICTILADLLIYFCIIEITGSPILEHIINEISNLIDSNKLNQQQKNKLKELLTKYKSISGEEYNYPKTLTK